MSEVLSSIQRAQRQAGKEWDGLEVTRKAALSIIASLNGRKGLHINDLDEETQGEIADVFASIIREVIMKHQPTA